MSIFDIAGPIMVGPSSSHTAGACKIGQFASALFHHKPKKVIFNLHGSFAEVFMGHATDKALLGGVLRFRTSDPRIKHSFEIADERGLKYEFKKVDLGANAHPNSVKIELFDGQNQMSVVGQSVGGGMIEIIKVDDFDVHIKGRAGKRLSLVAVHDCCDDVAKTIHNEIEKFEGIQVAEEVGTSYRQKRLTIFGLEGRRMTIPEIKLLEKSISGLDFVRSLSKLQGE